MIKSQLQLLKISRTEIEVPLLKLLNKLGYCSHLDMTTQL
jgi:hypothetical protein